MNSRDHDLLSRYVACDDQGAFASLVRSYVDLVFSAARRQVRSDHLAEEVAQAVFFELGRHATRLGPQTILPAWLYTITRRKAIDVVRRERSRRVREQAAVEIAEMNTEATDWTRVEPVLDDAMSTLPERERTAVLLRFFENKSFREISQILQTSEDAAQKRVSRALDRLRFALTKRGVTVASAALTAGLSANAVQTAPAGLVLAATSVSSGAMLTAAAVPVAQILAMTTLQKVLVCSGLAIAVAGGLYQASVVREQRRRIADLEQSSAAIRGERDAAHSELESIRAEMRATDATLAETESLLAELGKLELGAESLTSIELKAWAARRRQLKAWVELLPERTIPEMKLLTESDWLQASRDADLETENGARKALSQLRGLAKRRAVPEMQTALKNYLEANEGLLPVDPLQLLPYTGSSVDRSILERYEVVTADQNHGSVNRGQWQIVEREDALVDDVYGSLYSLGKSGWGTVGWNRAQRAVDNAIRAYRAAHGGAAPVTTTQIMPYVAEPGNVEVERAVEHWAEQQQSKSLEGE